MKRKEALFVLIWLPLFQGNAQWTTPQQVDMTSTASQSDPLVAVGPNRELAIVCTESSGSGKLLCYKSTDLGATFARLVVAQGGSSPPWYSWTAGVPADVGFNNAGTLSLLFSYIYTDDMAEFSEYVIGRMNRDSTGFTNGWHTRGPGGTLPSTLANPAMDINDTVLHVLRDVRSSSFDYTFMHSTLSGDSLRITQEDTMFTLPNGYFDADILRTNIAVHSAISLSNMQGQIYRLYYSRRLHQESTFSSLIPVDTVYATTPHIADLGRGNVALVYAAGNGATYSDSLLMARVFVDGSTSFPPPFKLAAKPTRPAYLAFQSRSPRIRTLGESHYLVYRSYDLALPMVAYYEFADVQSAPLDSAFFTGNDFGDLALDSLGGKYLVMVGPNGRVYLSKKDVLSSVSDSYSAPTAFALMKNYPNPFNPATHISYSLRVSGFTSLKVFDVLGREVATLVNEMKEPGVYTATFDASNLASGVYLCTMIVGKYTAVMKMVLMR
jgi:hypothetical protein